MHNPKFKINDILKPHHNIRYSYSELEHKDIIVINLIKLNKVSYYMFNEVFHSEGGYVLFPSGDIDQSFILDLKKTREKKINNIIQKVSDSGMKCAM